MKVCFDACVAIDILGATTDLKDSIAAYDVACIKNWDVCLPASSLGAIVCVLESRKMKSRAEARGSIGVVFDLFDIIDLTTSDCALAYASGMKDFEDAQIAFAAARAGVDVIVTRNKRDFSDSPVSAMTPEEFVEAYKPANYFYEEVLS